MPGAAITAIDPAAVVVGSPWVASAQKLVSELRRRSVFKVLSAYLVGMFIVLPVLALYAETLPGGRDHTLVGLADYTIVEGGVRLSFANGLALTGGVNWDWRLKDPRYSVAGYWAGSTVRGNTDAIGAIQENPVHFFQRPDAGNVDLDRIRNLIGFQPKTDLTEILRQVIAEKRELLNAPKK